MIPTIPSASISMFVPFTTPNTWSGRTISSILPVDETSRLILSLAI
jgi:hypothetical protein